MCLFASSSILCKSLPRIASKAIHFEEKREHRKDKNWKLYWCTCYTASASITSFSLSLASEDNFWVFCLRANLIPFLCLSLYWLTLRVTQAKETDADAHPLFYPHGFCDPKTRTSLSFQWHFYIKVMQQIKTSELFTPRQSTA